MASVGFDAKFKIEIKGPDKHTKSEQKIRAEDKNRNRVCIDIDIDQKNKKRRHQVWKLPQGNETKPTLIHEDIKDLETKKSKNKG